METKLNALIYDHSGKSLENLLGGAEIESVWSFGVCCGNCWRMLFFGNQPRHRDSDSCRAEYFLSLEKVVLWIHGQYIKDPYNVKGFLRKSDRVLSHVVAIVVTSMTEADLVLLHRPQIIEQRLCVWLRDSGSLLCSSGERRREFHEGASTLYWALCHAMQHPIEHRLKAFQNPEYWYNPSSARLFNVRWDDSALLLLALWFAEVGQEEELAKIFSDSQLSFAAQICAGREMVETVTYLRREHNNLWLPVDLYSDWRRRAHDGQPPSLKDRGIEAREWLDKHETQIITRREWASQVAARSAWKKIEKRVLRSASHRIFS